MQNFASVDIFYPVSLFVFFVKNFLTSCIEEGTFESLKLLSKNCIIGVM